MWKRICFSDGFIGIYFTGTKREIDFALLNSIIITFSSQSPAKIRLRIENWRCCWTPHSLQCFKTPAGGALTCSCTTNMTAWELPPSQYSAPVLVRVVGSCRKNSWLSQAFVSFAFHHRLPIRGVCAHNIVMSTRLPHPQALCQCWDGDKQIRLVVCVITLWFMARLGFCSHHLLWSGW